MLHIDDEVIDFNSTQDLLISLSPQMYIKLNTLEREWLLKNI